MSNKFKQTHSFEIRKKESGKIMEKYPDRYPIIIQKSNNTSNLPHLEKQKYLVPGDLTIGQIVYIIRRRIKLTPEKAIFIFVNKGLPPTSEHISTIYHKEKDPDGFLYITFSGENTFG